MVEITDKHIEATIEAFEKADEQASEQQVVDFTEKYPEVLAWLYNEDARFFTVEEKEFIFFMLMVIWKSVERGMGEGLMPSVGGADIEKREDANWEKLNKVKERQFTKRLDVFFKDTKQEDLLAFIEDALATEQGGDVITNESREPIFVFLKSFIDCLTLDVFS